MQPGGETSLHLAAQRGLQTCLKILLEQPDADVDAKDMSGGRTPLYLAATNKQAECARMLIENGASLDNKGSFQKKKTEDLVNLALFPLGPPLPTQIVKNIIVKIGPYSRYPPSQ